MRDGRRIYSAAYIMPPGSSAFGRSAKHQNHLLLLERMMADRLPERLGADPDDAGRLREASGLSDDRRLPGLSVHHRHQLQRDHRFQRNGFRRARSGRARRAAQVLRRSRRTERARTHPADGRSSGAGVRAPGPRLPIAVGATAPTDRLPELVLRSRQVCACRSPADRRARPAGPGSSRSSSRPRPDRALLSAEMEVKRQDTCQRRHAARHGRAAAG